MGPWKIHHFENAAAEFMFTLSGNSVNKKNIRAYLKIHVLL